MNDTVSDLMRPRDSAIRITSRPAEAAAAMLSAQTREATVVDEDGNLIGVVHADDLFNTHEDTIASIVKPARVVVPADASLMEVVRIMQKVGCDHAVVVEGERVIGMFTSQESLNRLSD